MPVVRFSGVNGVSLIGELELPQKSTKRMAGLVLVAGSGPTDRNGNQLPALRTDLLAQLAAALAKQGIATLRYDKRGIGESGKPKKSESVSAFFDWPNFVADVEAAATFLKAQPQIDPKRVGLLGHSEGGMLCLEAAAKVKPAALVLASTPGRSIEAVLTDQLAAILKAQKATPEQTAFFLSDNIRIARAIKRSGVVPPDVPAGLAALYPAYLGPFLKGMLSCEPVELAKAISCPTLVLQGERDLQVNPTLDARPLAAALGKRGQLSLIAGASHNLKPTKNLTDPAFTGPVAPAALEALTRWAAQRIG
ncbi:MAG: alpha/beta hydrolase [Armatimonas sp.]